MKLKHRNDLARLATERGVTTAAEIGVHKGRFSDVLLTCETLTKLVMVDPWGDFRGQDGDRIYRDLRKKYRYDVRVEFCREYSVVAAREVRPYLFDLVYIDGDHRQEAVAEDLRAWWPKAAPGCIFAGHDYCRRHDYGVIEAVDEFFEACGRVVDVIDDGNWPTWWVLKC